MNNKFLILVENLNINFDNKKKLKNLKHLLEKYEGQEWNDFLIESNKSYGKSLMYSNKYYDIYLICWKPNQKSLIHDHPENGCLLKVLKGELIEEIYEKIDDKFKKIRRNIMSEGNISYQEGKSGLHKVLNNSKNKSISLHIYSPPNSKMTFYKD
jgi:cysteine dioxygenase